MTLAAKRLNRFDGRRGVLGAAVMGDNRTISWSFLFLHPVAPAFFHAQNNQSDSEWIEIPWGDFMGVR